MASVNKVMLLGNPTRDNGERIEEVTYVDVTLWGRSAELAGQYLSKGRSVFIEGRLQLDQWDDKATGQKRSRLRVVGENMQFIGGQGQGGGGGNAQGGNQQQSKPAQQQQQPSGDSAPPQSGGAAASSFDDDADDIPF